MLWSVTIFIEQTVQLPVPAGTWYPPPPPPSPLPSHPTHLHICTYVCGTHDIPESACSKDSQKSSISTTYVAASFVS